MLIVDSHVHIWESGQPSAVHRQVPALTAENLLREMDGAGVSAAIIQPPAWDPTSNEVAIAASRRHPDRFAVFGRFEPVKDESPTRVKAWKDRPGMLGLRLTFEQPHQQDRLTDGSLNWLWAEAEGAGMPISLLAGNFLPTVGEIARRHPGLRLLIDHLGMKLRAVDDEAFGNMHKLLALAKFPNIAVKASAIPGYSSQPYPFRNIHPYLRAVHEAFGPERMFWGTDITKMTCSWRECVTLFTEELPWLSEADKELVMGRAICRWTGWELPV